MVGRSDDDRVDILPFEQFAEVAECGCLAADLLVGFLKRRLRHVA